MRRPRLAAIAVLAVLIASFAPLGFAQERPARPEVTTQDVEKALGTEWYGVYLLGNKVGFAKMVWAKTEGGKSPGYVMSLDMQMEFLTEGNKVEGKIKQTSEFDPEPPFGLRRGSFSGFSQSGGTVKCELTRTDSGYDVTQVIDGVTHKKQLKPLAYSLTEELVPVVWVKRGPKVGDQLVKNDFDFEELRLDPETFKVLSSKTSLSGGVKVTYYEIETLTPRIGVPGIARIDAEGRLLSVKLGGVAELRLEPEELAKQINKGVDLFVMGTVKVDKPLGDPTEVGGLVLEIVGPEAGRTQSGPRQTVAKNQAGKHICKTGAAASGAVAATEKEIKDHLKEEHDFPISHEKVQALAKEAVGDAKTPREKVNRLVQFVHAYIKPDDKVRPNRVIQLIEVRKGVCTEYALLFANLARAAGIPARVVYGLGYMGDDVKAFGPHAWNEVILDGQWVPVDAAWNETEIDGAHVRLGASRADQAVDLSALTVMLSTFGKQSYKLIEIQRRK